MNYIIMIEKFINTRLQVLIEFICYINTSTIIIIIILSGENPRRILSIFLYYRQLITEKNFHRKNICILVIRYGI